MRVRVGTASLVQFHCQKGQIGCCERLLLIAEIDACRDIRAEPQRPKADDTVPTAPEYCMYLYSIGSVVFVSSYVLLILSSIPSVARISNDTHQ